MKVKAKAPLTKFLSIVKDTLAEWRREPGTESLRYQLMHMRDILERWKVRRSLVVEPLMNLMVKACSNLLFLGQIVGLNRKIQIKPRQFEEYLDDDGEMKVRCTEVQLVLKWGGNLTKLGTIVRAFVIRLLDPISHFCCL